MEEIYVNMEYEKPVYPVSSNIQTGSSSSKRSIHSGVVFLVPLSFFLLVGLIILGVRYHVKVSDLSKLSDIKDNLTARLQMSNDKLSSMTEERDMLNVNLTEMTKQLIKRKTCPEGWMKFRNSCYLLSTKRQSWDAARVDCIVRTADLVVIEDTEEQTFLSAFTNKAPWIGLNDKEEEGTWKWVDGSALTLTKWARGEPNNDSGIEQHRDEDCAYIRDADRNWNDAPCTTSLYWICEKVL